MTKILQLSDLHIGPHNDAKDQKTYDLIQHMMTHYRPDITVLTGDQIWSEGVIDKFFINSTRILSMTPSDHI